MGNTRQLFATIREMLNEQREWTALREKRSESVTATIEPDRQRPRQMESDMGRF